MSPLTGGHFTLMTGIRAKGGSRLCGSGRHAGEMYLESGLQSGGAPIESFLMDPPMLIDPVEWGVGAIGINTFQDHEGVTHVLDWVGETHYPEMVDFIEEARVKGVSRRVAHNGPIDQLDSRSRLFLMHPRAAVTNAASLPTPAGFACPCGKNHRAQEGCVGLGWHVQANDGPGRRKLAQGNYPVKEALEDAEYHLAVFMVVPITALTVIEHPDPQVQAQREKRGRQSGLPLFVAPE